MAEEKLRTNRAINASSVRLIDENGGQVGVVDFEVAISTAEKRGMDLVEVSPGAKPPVCKLLDYGKFQYQQKKRLADTKRKQTTITVKEVKFRPRTDQHDFDHKLRNVRKFIGEGNKVKVKVFFRGREMAHPEIGGKVIDRIIEAAADIAKVESAAKLEGRQIIAVLGPSKTV